jgi:hypothetical protein
MHLEPLSSGSNPDETVWESWPKAGGWTTTLPLCRQELEARRVKDS